MEENGAPLTRTQIRIHKIQEFPYCKPASTQLYNKQKYHRPANNKKEYSYDKNFYSQR